MMVTAEGCVTLFWTLNFRVECGLGVAYQFSRFLLMFVNVLHLYVTMNNCISGINTYAVNALRTVIGRPMNSKNSSDCLTFVYH